MQKIRTNDPKYTVLDGSNRQMQGSRIEMIAQQCMGNTSITAGTDISIQYSQSNGPCPGGHQCDAAVFRVELASGSGHVVLGTADLNNGDDGGDRGPFTFTVTQAMLDSLATP